MLDPTCAVTAATEVLADRWCWLVVQEIARGHRRFDALVGELGISRKVLTERLGHLQEAGLVRRAPYQDNPPRHDYLLTDAGRALLPVLVGLQDWGDRWVLGDGEVTATATEADSQRVHALVGQRVPELDLPSTTGAGLGPGVLFAYPATRPPDAWADVPGAAGCTLENRLFRDRLPEFSVPVAGVSTQRPDEQRAFAEAEGLRHPLLSDAELELAAALRLPTVRVADQTRLRRLVLVIEDDRKVSAVRYPVLDIADTVQWALDQTGPSTRSR